jgi:hypothetical protein
MFKDIPYELEIDSGKMSPEEAELVINKLKELDNIS